MHNDMTNAAASYTGHNRLVYLTFLLKHGEALVKLVPGQGLLEEAEAVIQLLAAGCRNPGQEVLDPGLLVMKPGIVAGNGLAACDWAIEATEAGLTCTRAGCSG